MEHIPPQNLDMNAMRQKLKASRETATQENRPQNKSYIQNAQHTHYEQLTPTHNPHIERQASIGEKFESYKPLLSHLHNYWHIYIAAMTFILSHSIGMFPQHFPGAENITSPYSQAPIIAFFFLSVPALVVFLILRSKRRSLQNAAKITESKNWTQTEWIGAAIGFALLTYWTFFYTSPMEEFMVQEAIKGPFELTPEEWIMAGVKCVGGAVTGALLARKFFGDVSEE